MAFSVSDDALRLLEWPALTARLVAHLRTAAARTPFEGPDPNGRLLFESDEVEARARLDETSEARALLDAGLAAPLPTGRDLADALARVRRGGVLDPTELLDLRGLLAGVHDVAAFLHDHVEEAPRLAAFGELLPDLRDLQEEIGFTLSPEGDVRDEASPTLAEARRETRTLSSELTRRVESLLRDSEVRDSLSDTFYTLRNDRFVLPVRTDARRRVPGIVHDASASGTTLFVEPEAMVDQNNRLKQAELTVEREIRRVLRELCEQVASAVPEIERGIDLLASLDRAFARGRMSREMRATRPEVGRDGVFRLPMLRHPLIAGDEVVPNDVTVGQGFTVLVVSGPNAGGKTVAAKALALAALSVRAGVHVPAAPGSRVDLVDQVLVDIGDAQSLAQHLSTFSAHVANLARIVRQAGPHSLVVLDELGVGTDPSEGAALAQAVLETLADAGARVITTTHYTLLKEIAAVDARFENACVEFDPDTLIPTFRMRFGAPGVSSAAALAERMGLPGAVVSRARALMEGEDRQLDGLLSELAESRAALDAERAGARRAREEAESAQAKYASRLVELRERREKLVASMRDEVRDTFRDAHARVAAVIRDLQRGSPGQEPTARDAAHARERLLAVQEQLEQQVSAEATTTPGPEPARLDWSRIQPGERVSVSGGRTATLLSLPDRKGRVWVQLGSARTLLTKDRLVAVAPEVAPRQPPPPRVIPEDGASPADEPDLRSAECDLRGLRADEALDQVDAALDLALSVGRSRVVLVHGHGTGTLREAVRAHLARAPYVRKFRPGEAGEGGNGVTIAILS